MVFSLSATNRLNSKTNAGKLAFKAAKETAEEVAKKSIKNLVVDGLESAGKASAKIANATGYTKGKNIIKGYQQAILGDKLGTFTNTTGGTFTVNGLSSTGLNLESISINVPYYFSNYFSASTSLAGVGAIFAPSTVSTAASSGILYLARINWPSSRSQFSN